MPSLQGKDRNGKKQVSRANRLGLAKSVDRSYGGIKFGQERQAIAVNGRSTCPARLRAKTEVSRPQMMKAFSGQY